MKKLCEKPLWVMPKFIDKRGAGHIEIIIAFLLFIAAVGAALFFFRPGSSNRLVDVSLDYVDIEVTKNASVALETYSVILNNETIALEDVAVGGTLNLEIRISGVDGSLSGVLVKDGNGNEFNAERNVDSIHIERPGLGWDNINFLTISFSDAFSNEIVVGTYNKTFYRLGSSEYVEILSEDKFNILVNNYNADYFGLRTAFNIPDRVNFGFGLEFEDGINLLAEREIPLNFEVFQDSRRVEVLRNNGEVQFADFITRVW